MSTDLDICKWYEDTFKEAQDAVAQEYGYASMADFMETVETAEAQGMIHDGPSVGEVLKAAQEKCPLTQEQADAIQRVHLAAWAKAGIMPNSVPDREPSRGTMSHSAYKAYRETLVDDSPEAGPTAPDYVDQKLRSDERKVRMLVEDLDHDNRGWSLAEYVLASIIFILAAVAALFLFAQTAYASDNHTTVIHHQTVVQGYSEEVIERINRQINTGAAHISDLGTQVHHTGNQLQSLHESFAAAEDTFYAEFEEMGGGVAGAFAADSISMDPNGGWQIGGGVGTFRGEFFAGAVKVGGPLGDDVFLTATGAADGSTVSGAVGITIKLGQQYLRRQHD